MLRVEICDSAETLILRLEGRFTGDDAEHTRTLAARFAARGKLLVDLTEVRIHRRGRGRSAVFSWPVRSRVRRPQFLRARCVRASEFGCSSKWQLVSERWGSLAANGDQSGPNRSKPRKR